MKTIPYARHFIDSSDINQVLKVLKSGPLTQGPKVNEFEQALCRYTGAKYAVCVSSATAGLHLALKALDLGKGDQSITSPITFSASANCALYLGALPGFVDIDSKTYHFDLDKLKDSLKVPSKRKKVKVVVPVHLMGTVMDIKSLKSICSKYGIAIVEDAAHALGAKYRDKDKTLSVGGCNYSDIAVFSFHPIKHITTGEGGVVLTNNKRIYKKVLRLRHHGIVKSSKKPNWFYDIKDLGFNYRITDFQCALGLSQLKKLDKMVKSRREMAGIYNKHLEKFSQLQLPFECPNTYASYHLYVIRELNAKRKQLAEFLKKNNISTQVNYLPVHLFTYYRKNFGFKPGDFPCAEEYAKQALSLPLYYGLTLSDQKQVLKAIDNFFS